MTYVDGFVAAVPQANSKPTSTFYAAPCGPALLRDTRPTTEVEPELSGARVQSFRHVCPLPGL